MFFQGPALSTLSKPLRLSSLAAIALRVPEAQQTMTGFRRSNVLHPDSSSANGMLILPSREPLKYSAGLRTSTITAPSEISDGSSLRTW